MTKKSRKYLSKNNKKACFTINIQKTRGYKKKAQQEICYIAQTNYL